ncbi:MAG: methionine ABC transporter substrate-binding protein [Propionibacteriaceae bacterium]|jgi:D-methionine transport system substrate-binding protein|nr:methionine ABC transporter substrate-binding protein [Propionibacteriaceae bacterium]
MTTTLTRRRSAFLALLLAFTLVALSLLTACSKDASGSDGQSKPIRIGVVGASDPYWATYVQTAKDAGIDIELVDFTDYALPNPALTEGDLDINQFQHIVYLANYIATSGKDLVPLGSTAIYPLSLFSKKYTSVADIPDGATVVIPDDPSNQARGLLVLQSAGLVTLKGGGSIFSSLADIDQANSRVKVTEVAADLTPSSLNDAAAAIINNDYVVDAGLSFDDAIAKDDPSDPNALPYVNIFAVRPEDKDNATYLKLVELFQDTTAVTDGLQEVSGGVAEIVKIPQADLQAALDKTVADTKAQG